MKKKEIRQGAFYVAKVSNKLTTVRVDEIRELIGPGDKRTAYLVTNMTTGRKTTFRSAQKFRQETSDPTLNVPKKAKPAPHLVKDVVPNCRCVATKQREFRTFRPQETTGYGTKRESKPAPHTVEKKPFVSVIRTPLDERTPPVCQEAEGLPSNGSDIPHDTKDPQNLCRCVVTSSKKPKKIYGAKQSKLAESLRRRKNTGVDKSPHLIVEARAGTGKTTTLVEGLKRILGQATLIDPSPQQAAVWEAMELSKGKAQTIGFVAFNKAIAVELQGRVPVGCSAMTMHSMGFKAIRKVFAEVSVSSFRVQDIISELLATDIRDLRKERMPLIQATERLVSLCKMNLIGFDNSLLRYTAEGSANWAVCLTNLASQYDVDLNGNGQEAFDLVPRVLERCKDVARDGKINFDDMIWLPIVLGLNIYRYDLLLVDEAQDLNRCQQELAMKAGRRLILCGDPKQAIYGFAGADTESMNRMQQTLSLTERGCQTLPLTVTRRCGKAIVKEAQKLVPDFEAHETCCDGRVSYDEYKERYCDDGDSHVDRIGYQQNVEDGDMVLCRVNAPLVSECFKFLKMGRRANIQGRDVGQGLISTIRKITRDASTTTTTTLLTLLGNWLDRETHKEQAKRNPSDSRLIALQDRHDCIVCFTEDQATAGNVVYRIEMVFTDDKNGEGIMLSSVHKAKGLEAKRVFLLQPEGATIPHPMAKTKQQREQEMNLLYVAITRAIEELVYVS